jgi:hypothetical protein
MHHQWDIASWQQIRATPSAAIAMPAGDPVIKEVAMRSIKLVCLAALALLAFPAGAVDATGVYVGAGVGSSDLAVDGFSGNDFAYKVFAGFDFNPYIGVEGGYLNGGSPSDRGFDIEVDGWDLAVLGKWPVSDQFEIFARLGYVWWDAEADGFGSDSGEDLMYGLGVGFDFNDQFGVRGEWERMDIEDTDRADLWTVSLLFRF